MNHHRITRAAGSRRPGRATHTLTTPYATVWILAAADGQVIRAVTADGIDDATVEVGPLGDDAHHQWLRRGPGRYSRVRRAHDLPTCPR